MPHHYHTDRTLAGLRDDMGAIVHAAEKLDRQAHDLSIETALVRVAEIELMALSAKTWLAAELKTAASNAAAAAK